jgi:predicted anti-sigma-YlaC factor YlaD
MRLFRRKELACIEVVEVVTDYLEGVMPARKRRLLEQHLIGCDGCEAYIEQMRRTIETTGRLREEDVPPELEERLLAAFESWKRA